MTRRSIVAIASLVLFTGTAEAEQTSWNTWTSISTGSMPTPAGPVQVTFSGNASAVFSSYPSYLPAATWADGSVVLNPPSPANGILQLTGGTGNVQTVTFTPAVVDPVMAIWSLGAPPISARFVFQGAPPVFLSGGMNAEYGGQAISITGNTVSGNEGNGTIQFKGTITSISWTNPDLEVWYGFNVGVPGSMTAWTHVGPGTSGTQGVPKLAGAGTLTAGSTGCVTLVSANPSSAAVIFASLSSTPTPLAGGVLIPTQPSVMVFLVTDSEGEFVLPFTWPAGVPTATSVFIQCAVQDPQGVMRVSLSNALQATAP